MKRVQKPTHTFTYTLLPYPLRTDVRTDLCNDLVIYGVGPRRKESKPEKKSKPWAIWSHYSSADRARHILVVAFPCGSAPRRKPLPAPEPYAFSA